MEMQLQISSRTSLPSTLVLLLVTLGAAACVEKRVPLAPTADQVESYYSIPARFEISMNGNVAEIDVWQPWDQLERGGTLWAKLGPYIYLFTPATRDLMVDFDGLAAVRVTTRSPSGERIARATLARDTLNALTWKRALNVAGKARQGGGRKVGLLSDLVEYGEDHTRYEYNPRFIDS